jgi:hypothetical protein
MRFDRRSAEEIESILGLERLSQAKQTSGIDVWEPNRFQNEFLKRPEREVLGGGSRGGGKSAAGRFALSRYHEYPQYQALVLRKNSADLGMWMQESREFFRPLGATFTRNPASIRFPAGGEIFVGHMKDESSYEKYLGGNIWIILIEELTQIAQESLYEKVISSCRCARKDINAQIFSTTNPGGVGHLWVKKRFIDHPWGHTIHEDGTTKVFVSMPIWGNKYIMENSPEYVDSLKAIKDENLRKAWLYGDWEVFMGQFFSSWNPKIHVIKPRSIPEHWHKYRAVDYAHRNPMSVLWAAVDDKNPSNILVYRELLESGLTVQQASTKIKRMSGKERYIKTIAGKDLWAKNQEGSGERQEERTMHSREQLFRQKGINLTKANMDRVAGWNNIKEMMNYQREGQTSPRIFISEECEQLIEHMPYAVYHKTKKDDIDTGEGENNYHWDDLDALRYLLMHTEGKSPRHGPFNNKGGLIMAPIVKVIQNIGKKTEQGAQNWLDKH